MSNTRASQKGAKEPVGDGLLLLLTPVKISSKEPITTPVEATSDGQKLAIYRDFVPGSMGTYPLHQSSSFNKTSKGDPIPVYTGIHPHLTSDYVVIRRKAADGESIFKLLNKCNHSNVLKPTGAWESGDMVSLTFPRVQGTLDKVERSELFIIDATGRKEGFTREGQIAFRDLISAVQHVNERAYVKESSDKPLPVWPLQLVSERIFYQRSDATGAYHVYIGDFYAQADRQNLPKTLRLNVASVTQYNWKSLGVYLETLIGDNANTELIHLMNVLKGASSSSPIKLDDILWEPALWDSATKMHFIREVYFSMHVDSTGRRSRDLQRKAELGLHAVIALLGVTFTDDDLLGSINFLRNKIVAHQEDPYMVYNGDKLREVGMKKSTLEQFVLKNKPDYMLKLVGHIRPLRWISESPLLRSKSGYMKVLKPV